MGILASDNTSMDKITVAMGEVLKFAGTVIDAIVDQPVLAFIFAAGIVGIGITVVSQLKHAAK